MTTSVSPFSCHHFPAMYYVHVFPDENRLIERACFVLVCNLSISRLLFAPFVRMRRTQAPDAPTILSPASFAASQSPERTLVRFVLITLWIVVLLFLVFALCFARLLRTLLRLLCSFRSSAHCFVSSLPWLMTYSCVVVSISIFMRSHG